MPRLQVPPPGSGKAIASIFLLPHCDMECSFCGSKRGFDTLAPEDALALVDGLAGHGLRNVVLGGGEPLLWRGGLSRLALHARERGMLVQLNTNGVAAPPEFPRIPGVDRVILPLESMQPEVHDELRRRRAGHFDTVMRRIDAVVGAGMELTIATVLTSRNVLDSTRIASYLCELRERGARLHAWHLYRFLPVGRAGRVNAALLEIDQTRFAEACAAAKAACEGFAVYRRSDMTRSSTVEFYWMERGRLRVGYGTGDARAALSPAALSGSMEDHEVHAEA